MGTRILYRLLRAWVRLGARFYFRDLRCSHVERVPATGPVLFAANHQNSFLDAVLIAIHVKRPIHFLVRADVFRKPWARRMLHMLNMMPVFRIRDGWNTLSRNAESFSRCVDIWLQDGAVLIFPEGNHSFQRRIRPLSRGFTKPIQAALERRAALPIQVVPVGLNFTDHDAARSGVHVCFGIALRVQDYKTDGNLDPNALREDLAVALKNLVTHVENPDDYARVADMFARCGVDYMDPEATNARIGQMLSGYEPGMLAPSPRDGVRNPLVRGIHLPVLWGWCRLRSTIKDPMFIGSLKFVYAVFAVPVYYALVALALILILC